MSDITPELRALVDNARHGDTPSADERARVRQGLALKLGAAAFATGTVASAGVPFVASTVVRVVVAVALGAGATTGAVVLHRKRERTAATAQRATPHPTTTHPTTHHPTAPVAAPTVTAQPVAAAPVASPAPARTQPPRTTHAAPTEHAPPPPSATDLADEVRALREAQRAMTAGDPARALSILDVYASSHADGPLRIERAGARLVAQCQLHRERALEVQSFLMHHASSPLAARVAEACPPR